jgi:hypothetical protein
MDMLSVMMESILPANQKAWNSALINLQKASLTPSNIGSATAALRDQLKPLEAAIAANPPSVERVKAIRIRLTELGESGLFDDFTSAEQAFLALESLSYSIGDRDKYVSALDGIYKSVDNEFSFEPAKFRQALGTLRKQL